MLNVYIAKGGAITGFLQTAWQTKLSKTNMILNPFRGTAYFEDPSGLGSGLLYQTYSRPCETPLAAFWQASYGDPKG